MLSRKYFEKLKQHKDIVHPLLKPNYASIDPRCIIKVDYSHKKSPTFDHTRNKISPYQSSDLFFDPDKIYYKYNNHIEPVTYSFNKQNGRILTTSNPLPMYLLKQHDRHSCDAFSYKSLEMNNYFNSKLSDVRTSFGEKKSFNYKINLNDLESNSTKAAVFEQYLKHMQSKHKGLHSVNNGAMSTLNLINNHNKKLREYYSLNLDSLENNINFLGNQVNGVTLKTINIDKERLMLFNEREKKIFFPNFNEYEYDKSGEVKNINVFLNKY